MKLENVLKLSYDEYVIYLKVKYGKVPANYCYKTRNGLYIANSKQTSRTNEGLMIHHVLEDRFLYLADRDTINNIMPTHPETQDAENLVYCDYLEHLLLHIKITEKLNNTNTIYGWGGIFSIVKHINSAYQYYYIEGDCNYAITSASKSYKQHCNNRIIALIHPYLCILDYIMDNILNDILHYSDGHINVSDLWSTYNGEFIIAKSRVMKNSNYNSLVTTQRNLRAHSRYNSLNEVYQNNA